MALRWKKNAKPTGLMRIGVGTQGSSLSENGVKYASTSMAYPDRGWFWVAGWDSNVPHYNSGATLVATEEQAKADAMTYVKEQLKLLKSKS